MELIQLESRVLQKNLYIIISSRRESKYVSKVIASCVQNFQKQNDSKIQFVVDCFLPFIIHSSMRSMRLSINCFVKIQKEQTINKIKISNCQNQARLNEINMLIIG